MKKHLLIAFLCIGITAGTMGQQTDLKKFHLEGSVSAVKQPAAVKWVYLSYSVAGDRTTDSFQVRKGKYHFTGFLAEPVMARVRVAYNDDAGKSIPLNYDRDMAALFLQPGKIHVSSTDSFSNIKVEGSKANDDYLALQDKLKPYNDKEDELSKRYTELYHQKDQEGMKKMVPLFDSVEKDMRQVYKQYVLDNPASPIALYAADQFAGYEINADEAEPVFDALPATTRNLPSAKNLAERIAIAKKTAIGKKAMDFTQDDTTGNPVSLASFRGRYVLLDFWASWCGPCRAESPNLVEAFNKYKDKGFYILSVSLDRPGDKDKWMQAIHKDHLAWSHVSDLKFWDNAVAKEYGIRAIPQNFLLDPEGKIIDKNLRGDALEKKLDEIFSN